MTAQVKRTDSLDKMTAIKVREVFKCEGYTPIELGWGAGRWAAPIFKQTLRKC